MKTKKSYTKNGLFLKFKKEEQFSEIIKVLGKYSRKQDYTFLKILVRFISFKYDIPTKRNDWRTRIGMIKFISDYWIILISSLMEDSFLMFFCNYYEQFQKIFKKEDFSLFLLKEWKNLSKGFLENQIIDYLSFNLEEFIKIFFNKEEEFTISIENPELYIFLNEMKNKYFKSKSIRFSDIRNNNKEKISESLTYDYEESSNYSPDYVCEQPDSLF